MSTGLADPQRFVATRQLTGSGIPQGSAAISITVVDQAGNTAVVSSTSDGSVVTIGAHSQITRAFLIQSRGGTRGGVPAHHICLGGGM